MRNGMKLPTSRCKYLPLAQSSADKVVTTTVFARGIQQQQHVLVWMDQGDHPGSYRSCQAFVVIGIAAWLDGTILASFVMFARCLCVMCAFSGSFLHNLEYILLKSQSPLEMCNCP